jgi:single-strand DNA-binding protein
MESDNKVFLKGRLGGDPEQRTFESGDQVVRFSLATTDVYIDRNGRPREKTDWHRIAVFEQSLVETCGRLQKGDLVQVNGKLETRSYEKDGQKHYSTEVCVRPAAEHAVQLVQRPTARP